MRPTVLCRSYLYDDFFWGIFFLRNNPRISDFFDGFYFKTVKIIFFLPKNPVWGTVPQKNRFYLRLPRIDTVQCLFFCIEMEKMEFQPLLLALRNTEKKRNPDTEKKRSEIRKIYLHQYRFSLISSLRFGFSALF